MREIFFRGKSVNDGNWVQGSLIITTIEPADDTPIKHYHIEDMTIGVFPNDFQSGLSETVDPETVGQFTGLTDKNGKKIFEGDVVQDGYLLGKVVFASAQDGFDGMAGFMVDDISDGLQNYNGFWHEVEVLGNIHDNPELLGGDNDEALQ